MKPLFSFLFLLFTSLAAGAQSSAGGSIRGTVLDAVSGKPVDYATISLLTDSSIQPVNGGVADETGAFSIKDIKAGTYRLFVDFINYRRDTIDHVDVNNAPVQLGEIRLKPLSKVLGGVTVTASGPLVENRIDKIVYNAANDVTSQGGAALDVLRKVPQVTVDVDGNVELQGNANIRFLINGKPSSVFGSSVTDALSAIPANQIQRIEAITTPGAKYDAQGTGGIINIILKESRIQGYNGNISLSAGTRTENGSLNLNMRRGDFGLHAFFSGNALLTAHTPNTQDRLSADTAARTTTRLLQGGYSDVSRGGYEAGIGFDWNFSKKNVITGDVIYNHFGNHSVGFINQESITQDAAGAKLSDVSGYRSADRLFYTNAFDWNLNYKRKFGKDGRELDVAYDASYAMPDVSYAQAQTISGQPAPLLGSTSHNPGSELQTNFSVDYTHPLTQKKVLETGVKTMLQNTISNAIVTTLSTGSNEYVTDPAQSYHLQYVMNVYAGYLSASFPLFHFLDVKGGARYEYTSVHIDYPNTVIPAYGLLVPSLILSHAFADDHILKLAYTRRIERAEYSEINPFLDRSDPYNFVTGNPLLKPEIGDNLELGYSKTFKKGGSLNISLIERINGQDHKRVVTFYPDYRVGDSLYHNVSVQTNQNTGTEYNSGINLSGSAPVADKLSLRGNAMLFHRYLVTDIGNGNTSIGFRFRMNLNATYQVTPTLVAEAFGNYSSAAQNIQGKSPQWFTYTVALRRQFWHKKASLGITATNPFNEYVTQVTTIVADGYSSYVTRQLPVRSFGISFAWKFGRLEFKQDEEDDHGDAGSPPAGMGGN